MIRGNRIHGALRLAVALAFGSVIARNAIADDPSKSPYRWEQPIVWNEPEGPEAREHASMIVDEESDSVLLIGGLGYKPKQFTPLDDVWRLSLKTNQWTRLKPTTKAPAGGSRRVAQAPGRKVAWLFGGLLQNELVEVDFSQEIPAFTAVPQDNAPPPRGLHAFAYDPKLDRFLVFGGMNGDLNAGRVGVLNDVWTMKLEAGRARWTEIKTTGGPSPRSGFAYAYDTQGGRLIVFGGSQSAIAPTNEASDTWALHLREEPPAWREWKDGAPPARRNPCFVWVQGEQRLFVCCGAKGESEPAGTELHVLDARPESPGWQTWPLAEGPAKRASGFGFHDPARERVLMGFGNYDKAYRDLFPLQRK